ncbi:MAG: hypothetical protein ACSHXB_04900 [Sulfitobacter sp.]
MTRPTLHGMRENIFVTAIGTSGLAADQCLKRNILESVYAVTSDPKIGSMLRRQDNLIAQQEIAKQHVARRRKPRKPNERQRRRDFRSPEAFNECGLDVGRSYASRAGERMEKKQAGFCNVLRHPTTIDLAVVPAWGDANQAKAEWVPIMRDVFTQFTYGAQIEGNFQLVMKTAAEIAAIIPAEELPNYADPIGRPGEVFALLHWHGIIADPQLSKKKVRMILSNAFPGSRRVCVRKVQPERINKHGEITHGAQGYLEYSAMEKTEINFSNSEQKKAAVIGLAKLSATWSKRNRQFSMGKSLAVTGAEIDPSRVIELEVMERLDFVKKNWDKLGCAEQFIHLWFSGMIDIIRQPQAWLKQNSSITERLLHSILLVKNWSTNENAQGIDFLDYVVAQLE